MAALEAKNKGNDAFSKKNYPEALKYFTEAINLDPSNHVLYSNRSATYASLSQWNEALQDANKTVELKPDWAKGYSRKGAALHGLGQYQEAVQAYQEGLKIEPNNDLLKQGLEEVKRAVQEEVSGNQDISSLLGQAFTGDVFTKIRMNPQLAAYLNDPEYVKMITEVVGNHKNITKYLSNKQFMATLSFLVGAPPQPEHHEHSENCSHGHQEEPKPTPAPAPKKETPKEEPKPEPMQVELTSEQKSAEDAKAKGNEAYKSRNFPVAIEHYTTAMNLDPKNMVYPTNRAAAYFEAGQYEKCIEDCNKAIEVGRSVFADYKQIAKAFTRMGNAKIKMEKYDEAIEALEHSLAEDRIQTTVDLLRKVQKIKEEQSLKAYINPQLSLEHKEKGNQYFKEGKFPESVKEYTEAIKRNPEDYVLYSNRAASYTKLAEYNLGLKDCDECLKRNPNFTKAFTRKGHIHFFMKEYNKALEAYDSALKIEADNKDALDGVNRTLEAINAQSRQQDDASRVENAMKDPEVQEILSDPVMRQILQDMQDDPKAAQDHLKNPAVMKKIQKLVSAGVLKIGGRPM